MKSNAPKVVHKLSPEQTRIAALAPVMQRWSELCRRQADNEPSATLRWYLQGLADAHHLDAARIREALAPSTLQKPPAKPSAFVHAYEALLNMLSAVAPPSNETPPEPP